MLACAPRCWERAVAVPMGGIRKGDSLYNSCQELHILTAATLSHNYHPSTGMSVLLYSLIVLDVNLQGNDCYSLTHETISGDNK